ncbi:MAG: MFS transporter [Candidatus Thorarchaeota archaeon]|jgi:MFS family permease
MERRLLGVFSAISFAVEMRRAVFYVFFILYLDEKLRSTYTQAGIIFSLMLGVNALSQIIWGWASDRTGKRKHFLIIGEAIPGVVFLFAPQITNISVLAMVLIAIQVLWSMAAPAWKALIAEHSQPGNRGSYMGKITTFGGIGSIVGVYIVGDLIPHYGYAYFFYFCSLCMFLSSSVALFLKEPQGLQPSTEKLMSMQQIKQLHTENRHFSLFTILILFSLFATELISKFLPLYAKTLGGSIQQISYIFILEDAVATILMTPIGKLTDRIGKVKMLQISLVIRTIAVLLFAAAPVWWVLFPIMVVESTGWSGYHISWFAVLSSLTPRTRRGTYMGFHNMITSLSFIASSVGGSLADTFGLKVLFFTSFGLTSVISLYFMSWLRKNKQKIDQSDN